MNASFGRLMGWEIRRLRAEPTSLVLLIVWIGLVAVAAWQGTTITQAAHTEIETARAADRQSWQAKRALLEEIEAGRAAPQEFGDPRKPTSGVMGGSSDRPVVKVPAPLAAFTTGASDTAPVVNRAGMLTKVYLPPDNLDNPANRLAGRLDLVFLVSALLPLFVLALAFDVLARERELGIWPLLASQPTKVSRILAARLGLHFLLLWSPLTIAAATAVLLTRPADYALLATLGELLLWLALAAIYLVFWQALAAWINVRGRTAAGNALALCGAWLAFAVLVPAVVQSIARNAVPAPDHLNFVLAQRDVDIALHRQADTLRGEFYARHGYQLPTVVLDEYETFYLGNIVPRAFTTDEKLAPALEQIRQRREARAAWVAKFAWLSPALAFRVLTDQLAGATPPQQHRLVEEARHFQQAWRALFGAKLASMTFLTTADYDSKPQPRVVVLSFDERLSLAAPAIGGLLAAFLLALFTVIRAHDQD